MNETFVGILVAGLCVASAVVSGSVENIGYEAFGYASATMISLRLIVYAIKECSKQDVSMIEEFKKDPK